MSDLVEQVARALCEVRIRNARRHDTPADKLERMMPDSVDHNWFDFAEDARAALSVLEPRIEALERELAEAREAERERCAAIAENAMVMLEIGTPEDGPFTRDDRAVDITRATIAAAIRNGERGE